MCFLGPKNVQVTARLDLHAHETKNWKRGEVVTYNIA